MMRALLILLGIVAAGAIPHAEGVNSLDRIVLSSAGLVDAFGKESSSHVNVNQQAYVSAKITNAQEVSQPFVYILQIKNSQEQTVWISTTSGGLDPGQSFNTASSWAPEDAGMYTAEIYVWESLRNRDALTKPVILEIVAS